MKINQLKISIIISYMSQAVTILTGLLYTPVMLKLLGQSEYGLYQLVYSITSYLGLLSMGFTAGYVRFYSKYKVNGESKKIAQLNGLYLIVFSIISFVCIVCGTFMFFNAEAILGSELTASELKTGKILLALMIATLVSHFFNGSFENVITVKEKFFFSRILDFFQRLLTPLLTIPILYMGFGSVGMVAVSTFLAFVFVAWKIGYCLTSLKMRFSFNGFDLSLFKQIFAFTFFVFINIIIDRINWSVDKFLLGRMIGTVAVAIYGVAAQINVLYTNFSIAISGLFVPRIHRFVAENTDNKKLSELFARVGRLQFLVLALIVSGFTLFGREFIAIWAGPEYAGSYYVGLLLMIPGLIPLIQNLGVEIQKAKNMHKVCALVSLCIAIANIIISIPLIKKYSYTGAAMGTALSIIVGNLFINWYYHKRIGIDILHFWKEILKFFPALIISIALALILNKVLPPSPGFIALARNIIIYSLIYGAVFWLMGMNKSEKNLIIVPLKAVINKFKR